MDIGDNREDDGFVLPFPGFETRVSFLNFWFDPAGGRDLLDIVGKWHRLGEELIGVQRQDAGRDGGRLEEIASVYVHSVVLGGFEEFFIDDDSLFPQVLLQRLDIEVFESTCILVKRKESSSCSCGFSGHCASRYDPGDVPSISD